MRIFRSAALFLATALAALVFGTVAPPVHAAPVTLTDGSADWGFKLSFRNYAGGGTLAGGTRFNSDGTYHFPFASGTRDAAAGTLTLRLGGSVQWISHCEFTPCALNTTLSDLRVEVTPAGATLYADVRGFDRVGETVMVDHQDVPFARLDVNAITPTVIGGTTTWADVPAALTAEGAAVFAGFYTPGQALDPFTFADGPPTRESWTPAGTPLYERAESIAVPGDLPVEQFAWNMSGDELWGLAGRKVIVFDVNTLAVKGSIDVANGFADDNNLAIDLWTNTVFVRADANAVGTDGRAFGPDAIVGVTWDGRRFTTEVLPGAFDGGATGLSSMSYDYVNNRLYVSKGTTQTAVYSRDEVNGGWTYNTWNGFAGRPCGATGGIENMLPLSDGTFFGWRTALRDISFSTPTLTCTVISGWETITGRGDIHMVELADGSVRAIRETPEDPAEDADRSTVTTIRRVGGVWAVDRPADRPRFDGAALTRQTTVDPYDFAIYSGVEAGGTRKWVVKIPSGGRPVALDIDGYAPVYDAATIGYKHGVYTTELVGGVNTLVVYRQTAVSPSFTDQPDAATATIPLGGRSDDVSFRIAVDGDPAPTIQWQTKAPGGQAWSNLNGETGTSIARTVGPDDHGRQFRAVLRSAAGELASDAATVTVNTAPGLVRQPLDTSVIEGQDARIELFPTGNPNPDVTWQRRVGGFWTDIPADADDVTFDGGFLTVSDTNVEMSGARFRAKLVNRIATVYSRTVTLTVAPAPPAQVTFGSGTLDWGVKASFRSYIGGPIARGSYAASEGAVVNGDGTVRFDVLGGTYDTTAERGEIRTNGTVRFVGHDAGAGPLLDLTIEDPRLVVDGDTGTLFADVRSKSLRGGAVEQFPNVALATLDLSRAGPSAVTGGLAFAPIGGVLTTAGAPAFADFYPAATALDALSLTALYGTPREEPRPPVDERPPVDRRPPVEQPRTPAKPKWTVLRTPLAVTGRAAVVVATIACKSGTCRVALPRTVVVRIAGKRYRVAVSGPGRIAAGRRGQVRVRLSAAARRALAGRRATVRVRVRVRENGRRTVRTVAVTLKARAPAPSRVGAR